MCKLLFVSMCFLTVTAFRITDKLLPFDLLSILILDKLCMNLLCLYRCFFVLVLIYCIYFSNVTSTYYMEIK